MQRTIVGLRKSNGKYKVPKFSECILEYFKKNSNSITVNYSFENNVLFLNESNEGHELTVGTKHSPECPIKLLTSNKSVANKIKKDVTESDITIATSVVIESSDSYILFTKRSHNLRVSPNVWVLPGGHLENGESIFETGKREVKEETGLNIDCGNLTILGMWESVYPLLLGIGAPKSHSVIIYVHTKLNETYYDLTQKIIPNPDEVDSYCWISSSILSKFFTCKSLIDDKGEQYIVKNGELLKQDLDYNTMFNKWLWTQPEPYSGVNFAIRKFLTKIQMREFSCKY